jgi:hypothetical protein
MNANTFFDQEPCCCQADSASSAGHKDDATGKLFRRVQFCLAWNVRGNKVTAVAAARPVWIKTQDGINTSVSSATG